MNRRCDDDDVDKKYLFCIAVIPSNCRNVIRSYF